MQTATSVIEEMLAQEPLEDGFVQRFGEANTPGECIPQGDVYITLLGGVPNGCKPIPVRLQIADGSTQGSRHCLDSAAGVEMFVLPKPNRYDGPVMVLTEERTLTHPEHKHMILAPGCYGVHYQRNLDAEEREARVRD